MISMYADEILLCKPIHHPENYDDLQRDIGAVHECINTINNQGGRNLISHPLVWSLAMIPWSRLTTTIT